MTAPDPLALAAEGRRHHEEATPGEWYTGPERMALAGVLPERFGEGRCSCCAELGEPVWTGRADINGRHMAAHVHDNDDDYDDGGHRIYAWPRYPAPAETEVCTDYEQGGVIRPRDAEAIIWARNHLAEMADTIEALHQRATTAEADADRLAEALADTLPYVEDYFVSKHGMDVPLAAHKAAIAARGDQP